MPVMDGMSNNSVVNLLNCVMDRVSFIDYLKLTRIRVGRVGLGHELNCPRTGSKGEESFMDWED